MVRAIDKEYVYSHLINSFFLDPNWYDRLDEATMNMCTLPGDREGAFESDELS